jgi:hypothetical protein
LKVKEVWVGENRYILALNEEQARKDRADREAIVSSLREKLSEGDKSLVGNRGYRKFLKTRAGGHFEIDEDKIQREARFDGKWVLQTDTDLDPAQVALRYKDLWMVEDLFRTVKSVLRTRPIYHSSDEAIRGHVFCSFLALMLLKDLMSRIEAMGGVGEWQRLKRDLDALEYVTIRTGGTSTELSPKAKTFRLRTEARGEAGTAIKAAGMALGPVVQIADKAPQKA